MGTETDVVGKRLLAFVLDLLIAAFVAGILFGAGIALGGLLGGLLMLISSLVALAYKIVLEGLYGHTVGKYILGLVVVKSDGSNIGIGASLVRNLLLIVDSLPALYLIGLVVMFVTEKRQRVGDLVADTVVTGRE